MQTNGIKAYFKPKEKMVMSEKSNLKLNLRCNLETNFGDVPPPLMHSSSEICAERKCKPNISSDED